MITKVYTVLPDKWDAIKFREVLLKLYVFSSLSWNSHWTCPPNMKEKTSNWQKRSHFAGKEMPYTLCDIFAKNNLD